MGVDAPCTSPRGLRVGGNLHHKVLTSDSPESLY